MKADPLEVRNLGFSGANLTPAERDQLTRLKSKLLAVTTARLGPIPGFKWNIKIAANLTAGSGRAKGLPIGSGNGKISWAQPQRGQVNGTFAISARTGQIVGTARASIIANGNKTLTYVGTATVTGGTNAYRGFTSINAGGLLALRMTSSNNGAIGQLALTGRVTSAAVNGALILRPLDPYTGM